MDQGRSEEGSLREKPVSLYLCMLCGFLLAVWMALDGLHGRLFGSFLTFPFGAALWPRVATGLGLDSFQWAWPLVVIGTTWSGALMGTLMKLAWAPKTGRILAVLSLLYLGPGTLLGLVLLLCFASPSLQAWVAAAPAPNDA